METWNLERLILSHQPNCQHSNNLAVLHNSKTHTMPSQQDEKRQAAREVIDILYEISTLLVHPLPTPQSSKVDTMRTGD